MYPSTFNLAAGVAGLSTVVAPFLTDPVWAPVDIPAIEEFAMLPTLSPFQVQRDAASGPDGYIKWQFSDYFLRMTPWIKDTPRTPARGGFGGDLRVEVVTVQATEELNATELWPFANANTVVGPVGEQLITVQRVIAAMATARIRDRTDKILLPMLDNQFTSWDGLPLIHDNHKHPDGSLFSNNLIGGTPVPHMTNLTPPTRADVANPTVEELYNEIVFAMTYNSLIRLRIAQVQRVQRALACEIVVKDPKTLLKLQDLNAIKRGRFVDPLVDEATDNPLYGAISLNYDSRLEYTAGEENDYFIIPKLTAIERQPSSTSSVPSPYGFQVWNPIPRFLTFSVIRSAEPGGPDTHYDPWNTPSHARIGVWEQWGVGGGLSEEGMRFRPVAG